MISSGRVRLGSRGSALALAQAESVADALKRAHPSLAVSIEIVRTTGDLSPETPFASMGDQGVFVKELEHAVLAGKIDAAVHSLKDLPARLAPGLDIACIPQREDPHDALVSASGADLHSLKRGAVLGTSSLRRKAQMLAARPDLDIRECRGNIDTRLRKLDSGEYDAIVLAAAGLIRLGLSGRITQRLSSSLCMPAAGQGALAVEALAADNELKDLVAPLNHGESASAVLGERAFLARLGGGCSVPAGVLGLVAGSHLTLSAVVVSPDGSRILRRTAEGALRNHTRIGLELASGMARDGALGILKG
ncbi:MAG TPA: hydroxymethylbilane synthase [Chthonomonadales bacterium]|nr:hydroxymethylbilane synthase [Chthonomonadales bacterium]